MNTPQLTPEQRARLQRKVAEVFPKNPAAVALDAIVDYIADRRRELQKLFDCGHSGESSIKLEELMHFSKWVADRQRKVARVFKNPAAVALGHLNKGGTKTITEADRLRRRKWALRMAAERRAVAKRKAKGYPVSNR